jgi:hypothetical protein
MENKVKTYVEPTEANVAEAISAIAEFAKQNEYQIKGELKMPTNMFGMTKSLEFESLSKKKVLRDYLTRLNRKMSLRNANRFLHFLFKKIYKLDEAPKVDLSEKEVKIQAAKKVWKETAKAAELLRLAYVTEKGDYYKKRAK